MMKLVDKERLARLHVWWHRYAGSVAFLALIIISAIGFDQHQRSLNRLIRAERILQRDVQRLDSAEAAIRKERSVREAAIIQTSVALARHEATVARKIAENQIRAVRTANIEGCQRENQLRRRLRNSVAAQLAITRSTGTQALSRIGSVREFIEVMNRQERALSQLYVELDQVDCEVAYPSVTR